MSAVHHLNCATMCPRGARFLTGSGGLLEPTAIVAHVLVVETGKGLVLVDTGLGCADIAEPARTGRFFNTVVRPRYRLEETAIEQVRTLGHDPADVRHIVLTHLDVDHAGGLGDFPNAEVHLHETELAAGQSPGRREALRYIASQWGHGPKWVPHAVDGESWHGFEAVRAIPGLDPEILLVPLHGHTRGHSGVAVRDGERWLLHCGDAYFHHGAIADPPRVPPGFRLFTALVGYDRRLRLENVERLRELARHAGVGGSGEVAIFCAHDPLEFERLATPGTPSRLA